MKRQNTGQPAASDNGHQKSFKMAYQVNRSMISIIRKAAEELSDFQRQQTLTRLSEFEKENHAYKSDGVLLELISLSKQLKKFARQVLSQSEL